MRVLFLVLLGWALVAPRASAQAPSPIEFDGSLGPAGAPTVIVDGTSSDYRIDESWGRRSDTNLFHSFSRFSVPFSATATFSGDASIERILARVTGGSISQIAGTLRSTIDGADLYLMNPRGFIFSSSSSLDLRGSLHVSSASGLRLGESGEFSAVPISGEILSSAAPSAWGFTSAPAGTIRFLQARNLGVPAGETLAAVGGPVTVSGVLPTATLLAPGGTIALASRTSAGEVPVDVASLDARGAQAGELGTVTIGANAVLDVSDGSDLAATRGRIVIRGGALTIDSSTLRSDSAADAIDDAPDIDLETSTSILLYRSNSLRAPTRIDVRARGSADGGGLRLSSEEVTLAGAAAATTSASETAYAGATDVSAGSLRLSESSGIATVASDDATASKVTMNAGTIELAGGALISSQNESSAQAPEVEIAAADLLRIDSGAVVSSDTRSSGRGASLQIRANALELSTGARIGSETTAAGAGGGVEIRAARVAFRGAPQSSDPGGVFVTSSGSGAAGGVFVSGDDVVLEGGAQISATAQAGGGGGDVEIRATRELLLTGASGAGPSGIFARSGLDPATTATGDGGDVLVVAPIVSVADGAEISTQTFGAGTAGGIHIVAAERVGIAGGATATSSINAKASVGEGGDILVQTEELRLDDGGEISASTLNTGDSGDIAIEADRVYVGGGTAVGAAPAGIFAQSIPGEGDGIDGGDGGDIAIRASSLVEVRNAGLISARTRGPGAAGSVRVTAPVVTVRDGASISAETGSVIDSSGSGEGGNIEILASARLEIRDGGSISVTALGTGDAGRIVVRGTESVTIEGGEISGRSQRSGTAGSVTLDGVGELIVGAGGSITTETLADGLGGSIAIDAEHQVVVTNGGAITARSEGAGDAGSIAIDAGKSFSALNGGQVTTSAVAADGGDIAIGASRLIYVEDGRVTTDVRAGLGTGGNITIDPEFVVLNRAELRASAVGDGGNITIVTERLLRDASSVVDASSSLGIDGEIQTAPPTVDLTAELAQLDATLLDGSSEFAAACAARSGERGTFGIRGRPAPSSPDAPLESRSAASSPQRCR